MYKLKFTKLPKAIKKHLRENKVWQKFYSLSEANLLFSNAVFASQVTGEVIVTIICPTGEPEYEFRVMSDPDQSLSEQVLKDFDAFLDNKQAEIEALYDNAEKNKDKIKALEDDILILTNRAKEIRQEFGGFEDTDHEQDDNHELHEAEVLDAIITEEYDKDVLHEDDLFGDVEEPELVADLFPDVEEAPNKSERSIEPKQQPPTPKNTAHTVEEKVDLNTDKMQAYLDVSTFESIQTLENQIEKIDKQIEKGVDRYIFDELYLTSASDFASKEKRELIKAKHLPQANQTFASMRDWTKRSLEEIKQFSLTQLSAKHDELTTLKATTRKQRITEMAEMLKVTFDKKKGELRKEIIKKCDAEIADMEVTIDAKKDQKLAVEAEKIEQSLAKGFNVNHEKALKEHRGEIEKIAEEKANQVFETIGQGYDGLLAEIKFNLGEHERDIEARHQLYREDRKDEFAQDISNRELQLRARQIEIEERKLSQNNETRLLSEQIEQLKITLEKNRLEDQMQLMSRDKEEQAKEIRRFKRVMGISFAVVTLAMAGVVVALLI